MKLWKRIGALALTLALSVSCLTGCGKSSGFTVPESIDLTTVTDPYQAISGMSGSTVVATAGETEITAQQLIYWMNYSADNLLQYYSMYGLGTELPWNDKTEGDITLAESLKQNALETAALYALIPVMAQKDGLTLSDDYKTTFQTSLEQMNKDLGSEALAEHYLWYYPLTRDMYAHLCDSEQFNSMIMDQHFGKGTDGYPSDAEVIEHLEKDEQCYFFKHILLMVEETTSEGEGGASSVTTNNREEQKALAESLAKQLQESSDPLTLFDQLMKEYSEDTGLTAYPNGYLGSAKENSTVASKMVSVVEQACLSLENGQISGVLENTEGYHGFHIVLRLPVEGNVNLEDNRKLYIANQMTLMQDQWLEENQIVTTEAFEQLDPSVIYASLNVLRDAITAEAEVASSAQSSTSSTSNSSAGSASTSSAS